MGVEPIGSSPGGTRKFEPLVTNRKISVLSSRTSTRSFLLIRQRRSRLRNRKCGSPAGWLARSALPFAGFFALRLRTEPARKSFESRRVPEGSPESWRRSIQQGRLSWRIRFYRAHQLSELLARPDSNRPRFVLASFCGDSPADLSELVDNSSADGSGFTEATFIGRRSRRSPGAGCSHTGQTLGKSQA